MEGVSGISDRRQVARGTTEYQEGRHLLTGEVNAAVRGALAAGASDIIVADGHAAGHNFVAARLHPAARYVSSPRSARVCQGLDENCRAVLLVGFHARAGVVGGVLAHTQSGATWLNCYLNGVLTGETGQLAAIAGHFGVPVAFVSGDRAVCDEARDLLGEVETVAVKEGFAFESALMLAPSRAHQLIEAGVTRALGRLADFRAHRLATPVEVRLELQHPAAADSLQRSGWQRLDGRTVVKTVPDALGIVD